MALRKILQICSKINKNEINSLSLKESGITKRLGQGHVLHATVFDVAGGTARRQILEGGRVVRSYRAIENIPAYGGDDVVSVTVTVSGKVKPHTLPRMFRHFCKCDSKITKTISQTTYGEQSVAVVLYKPYLHGIIEINNLEFSGDQRIVVTDLTSNDVTASGTSDNHELSLSCYNIQSDGHTSQELISLVTSAVEAVQKFGFINYLYLHPLIAMSVSSRKPEVKVAYLISYAMIMSPEVNELVTEIERIGAPAMDERMEQVKKATTDPFILQALELLEHIARNPLSELNANARQIVKRLHHHEALRWNQRVNDKINSCSNVSELETLQLDDKPVIIVPNSFEYKIELSSHLRMLTDYESHIYQIRPDWVTAGEDLNTLKKLIDPSHITAAVDNSSLSVGIRAVVPNSVSCMSLASSLFNVRLTNKTQDTLIANLNGLM